MEGDYIIKSVMTRLLPIWIFLQLFHQKKLDRLVRLADKYITGIFTRGIYCFRYIFHFNYHSPSFLR